MSINNDEFNDVVSIIRIRLKDKMPNYTTIHMIHQLCIDRFGQDSGFTKLFSLNIEWVSTHIDLHDLIEAIHQYGKVTNTTDKALID